MTNKPQQVGSVRDRDEIQLAHDTLDFVVKEGHKRDALRKREQEICQRVRDTLCWVLHHPGGRNFAELVESATLWLKSLGLELAPREQVQAAEAFRQAIADQEALAYQDREKRRR